MRRTRARTHFSSANEMPAHDCANHVARCGKNPAKINVVFIVPTCEGSGRASQHEIAWSRTAATITLSADASGWTTTTDATSSSATCSRSLLGFSMVSWTSLTNCYSRLQPGRSTPSHQQLRTKSNNMDLSLQRLRGGIHRSQRLSEHPQPPGQVRVRSEQGVPV